MIDPSMNNNSKVDAVLCNVDLNQQMQKSKRAQRTENRHAMRVAEGSRQGQRHLCEALASRQEAYTELYRARYANGSSELG